jgi:hypothetical protein
LNFNIAGFEFGIACGFVAQHNFTNHRQHILAAHFLRLRVRFRRFFLIHDNLRDAVAVTQIDESQWPKVTPARAPTHQRHTLADVDFTQRTA